MRAIESSELRAHLKIGRRRTVLSWQEACEAMGAVAARTDNVSDVTLLELVQAVSEVTSDEREIVAAVTYMLRSGHARLIGNFRDQPVEDF